MLLVAGHFRFPLESLDEARPLMQQVVAATLLEQGCLAYSYAEDVSDPGLFRVQEAWESHDALLRHFATPHMQAWTQAREALGFYDRDITAYEVGAEQVL